MKKTLLLLFACLFGALGGAKTWTSATPEVGKAYYLHCTRFPNQFWYAEDPSDKYYHITSNLSRAVPVYIESISGTKFKMYFYVNGTRYSLHQHDGEVDWKTDDTMDVPGDANGYAIRNDSYNYGSFNSKTGHRYMWPDASEGGISFGKVGDGDAGPDYCWQFVPAEEVMIENGWKLVTSLSTSSSDLGKYYYCFWATEKDLMLGEESGTGKGGDTQGGQLTGVYRTPTNPDIDNTKVWLLEYDATNLYGIRNLSNPQLLLQSRDQETYRVQAAWERIQSIWTQWGLTYADSKWSIQNKLPVEKGGGDNNWIGPWDNAAFQDNMVVAGNAGGNGNAKSQFKIYRKSRLSYEGISYDYASATAAAPINVTGLIANANFNHSTTGWNVTGEKPNAFNTTYTAFEAFHRVSGINQNLTSIPNGLYTVSVQVTCRDDNGEKTAENRPKLTATSALGAVSAVCNTDPKVDDFAATAQEMSTDANYGKISVDVVVTDGNLNIALTESNDNTWPVYDNFTLVYSGSTVADVAEALPANGEMEAGKWYYFDIAMENNYDFTATTLLDVVYTTNGNDEFYADITGHFKARDNALSATRYYVKSSSNQTLTWSYSDNADITGLIVNPSFESDNMTVWSCETGNDTGRRLNSETNYTMSGVEGNYLFNAWDNGAGKPVSQTLSSIPVGYYKLTAVMATDAGATFQLTMNDETAEKSSVNKGTGVEVSVTTYVASKGNVTISAGTEDNHWYKVDNFRLEYLGENHAVIDNPETKTQTYEGTFTEDVDLTPTVECPIVDITGATFTGDITAHFSNNPNGIIYATSAQKIDMDAKAGGPVQNVISSAYDVCERLVITDGYSFVARSDFEATHATYSRTIGAASNFGTICVPFALTSNDDIQYYTTDQITGGVLKLTEVKNVAAGTPAIFKKQDSEATNITASKTATAVKKDAGEQGSSVVLKGTFERITIGTDGEEGTKAANGKYYIKNNQFCEGKDWFNIGAFRAYLEADGNNPARLSIRVDDEATAINELKTLDEKQGLKDGKYLIDGKIIVVKEGKQYNVNGVIK